MTSTYVRDQKRVQVLQDDFDESESDDEDDCDVTCKFISLIFSPARCNVGWWEYDIVH